MSGQNHILLVGCGKMGSAMLAGWLKSFPDIHVIVIEPSEIQVDPRALRFSDISRLPPTFPVDLAILAVKPQMMDEVALLLGSRLPAATPVLSIAAGKTLTYFSKMLGNRPLIRSMPNTPAAIGHGITVACANDKVTADQRELANSLLTAVGQVEWIEDESLMDAVTAVSGSGPAYVFLLIEELAKAAIAVGLPKSLAISLARQTVIGAAHLAEHEPQTEASTLRQNVTSPGGTTEAALKILRSDSGLGPLLERAVDAATRRSREFAG